MSTPKKSKKAKKRRLNLGKLFDNSQFTLAFSILIAVLGWLVVSLVRYFASAVIHRLFLCEEPRYRGRGSVLFAYEVLLGVVPMVILPFAASFFLLAGGRAVIGVLLLIVSVWLLAFLRALTLRYLVNFSLAHRRLTTTVNGWQAGWFVFGQLLLAGITLGIYWPMALLRIWRYYVGRTVIGDETVEMRFGFSTSLLTDFGRLFVQLLLTVVTCGIYLPWGYARTRSCRAEKNNGYGGII